MKKVVDLKIEQEPFAAILILLYINIVTVRKIKILKGGLWRPIKENSKILFTKY